MADFILISSYKTINSFAEEWRQLIYRRNGVVVTVEEPNIDQ